MPARPYLLTALLWAVVFHPLVLHPSAVLYADDSDFLAQHLPAKLFLSREVRETGELPLWNPYHFCGTPFVHDIQVGVFYPPYAVTYLVPEHALGAVLSWVVALHVLLAGVLMVRYARADGLGELGAFVAAAGFMLAGKWMTHLFVAGHTVTVGLAWLPLVLLWLGRAVRTGRAWPAVGAGAAFALLVLGTHPQWAFYAGVFAAAWTFGEVDRSARGVGRWLLAGLVVLVVTFGLTAVQLLPTAEASRYSARSSGVEASGSLVLGLETFFGLVGPALRENHPAMWETQGVFGAVWLAAALAAPAATGGRNRWRVGLLVGMIFFAVGGAALVEWLPGFGLFRVPGRMLLIAAFPVALLAGATTDALVRSGWGAEARRAARDKLKLVVVAGVLPCLVLPLLGWWTEPGRHLWLPGVIGWAGTLVAVAAAWWLLRSPTPRPRVWAAALVVELLAPTILLPAARPQADVYRKGAAVAYLAEHAGAGAGRVHDPDPDDNSVFGVGAPLALVYGVEVLRGYNPLDVRHYREYIGFVQDKPGPVRGNSPLGQQVLPNTDVENERLFAALGIRFAAAEVFWPLYFGRWEFVLIDPAPPWVPPNAMPRPTHLLRHAVYESRTAFPRAWLVPEAAPMPAGRELDALKAADLRRTVLLTTDAVPPILGAAPGPVRITEYRPNRVRVELAGGSGWLVLSDVWFPGWVCRVDGAEVPVERANHAFRAVPVPPWASEVVFTFEPRSYRVGGWVSAVSLGLLAAGGAARVLARGWTVTEIEARQEL